MSPESVSEIVYVLKVSNLFLFNSSQLRFYYNK